MVILYGDIVYFAQKQWRFMGNRMKKSNLLEKTRKQA